MSAGNPDQKVYVYAVFFFPESRVSVAVNQSLARTARWSIFSCFGGGQPREMLGISKGLTKRNGIWGGGEVLR